MAKLETVDLYISLFIMVCFFILGLLDEVFSG
jgi:hypothetical protein